MLEKNIFIKEVFNKTANRIVSSSTELYDFLLQNKFLYDFPINKIIEIYGQNPSATRLKTFEDWKKNGSHIIKGQKGIPTLDEPNNPYSKRTTYFDISQLVHTEVDDNELTLSNVQLRKFLQLAEFSVTENESPFLRFNEYVSETSRVGLKTFVGLTDDEKTIVPLVSQFSLNSAFNLSTEQDDLALAREIQEKFKSNSELRPLEVIKISNNLSKSIVVSVRNNLNTLQKAQQIEDERLRQLEQTFNQDYVDSSISENIFNPIDENEQPEDDESISQQEIKEHYQEDTQDLQQVEVEEIIPENNDLDSQQTVLDYESQDKVNKIDYLSELISSIDNDERFSSDRTKLIVKGILEISVQRQQMFFFNRYFKNVLSTTERAKYLAREMGWGGSSGISMSYFHNDDGLRLKPNTNKSFLIGWEEVAFWIDDLMSKNMFVFEHEKDEYQEFEERFPWAESYTSIDDSQTSLFDYETQEKSSINGRDVTKLSETELPNVQSLLRFESHSDGADLRFYNNEVDLFKSTFLVLSFDLNGQYLIDQSYIKDNNSDLSNKIINNFILDKRLNPKYLQSFIENWNNYKEKNNIYHGYVADDGQIQINDSVKKIINEQFKNQVRIVDGLLENIIPSDKISSFDTQTIFDYEIREGTSINEHYVIEFNEKNSKAGVQSFENTEITPNVLVEIMELDRKVSIDNGYYKFYLNQKDGSSIRLDVGDGINANSELYNQIADSFSEVEKIQFKELVTSSNLIKDIDIEKNSQIDEEFNSISSEEIFEVDTPQSFSFPHTSTFYPKTPTEKVNANLAAIKLVKILEKENRQATFSEQETLGKYVGWGGLANTFFDENLKRFEGQRETLKRLVTTQEYSEMRQSSLTAYYTDPEIIREIYAHLEKQGFKGGRILDPAMGTGNFFSAMPPDLRSNSELHGVELDSISGLIAKQLHPDTDIKVQGFETTQYNDNAFDLVIGNVPFADYNILDDKYGKPYAIHDYFFKKSMDLVRKGGVVAFITSTWTMNKRTTQFREEMNDVASFVGGVRLPNNAFKQIAGTDVSTDILFFKKGDDENKFNNWLSTTEVPDDFGGFLEDVSTNAFFADTKRVAGKYVTKNFHGKTLSVSPSDEYLPETISNILSEQPFLIEENHYDLNSEIERSTQNNIQAIDLSQLPDIVVNLEPQNHVIVDGNIYFNDSIDGIVLKNKEWFDNGYIQKRDKDDELVFNKNNEPVMDWSRTKWSKTTIARLTGMVNISNCVNEIISYQHEYPERGQDDPDFNVLLDKLNITYDTFTQDKKLKGKYGNFLNRRENAQLFEEDVNYYSVLALEEEYRDDKGTISYRKSDFFFKKTVAVKQEIVVSTPIDALNASVNKYGEVNFEYMSELLPYSKEEYLAELEGSIYYNPANQKYEQADEYLSGHITTKLEELEQSKDNHEISIEQYEQNKNALLSVMPEPLSITEIDYKIGSRFISTEIYQRFLAERIFDISYSPNGIFARHSNNKHIKVEYNTVLSKYLISDPTLFNNRTMNGGLYPDLIIDKQERTHNPIHIFNDMLNLKKTKIEYIDENNKKVVDPQLTAIAESKQKLIALEFEDFVLENEEIRKEITEVYNRDYNSTVIRSYDGSNLTFDGLTRDINLRPHQKNAVSRVVQSQRGLFAHVVGSGKTLSMIASGMKLKELGLANKPLYVVPKSILKQFASDVKKFYPDKKILSPSPRDFAKERRRKLVARIGAGNYDAVILSHEQFGKIPLTKEREEEYLNDELAAIQFAIVKAKIENGKSPSVKQMIALENRIEKQLENLKTAKDDGIIFENLGVDFMFVDEAHNFKNLAYRTQLSDVKGVNMTASQKASDLLLKAKYIQEKNEKGGGVVFATGTPVSNSMAEMYTMMRYLEPDYLIQNNIRSFDEWAALFAHIETNMEVDQTGQKWKQVTRFSKFNNLPELMKLYQNVADIQTADMLDLPTPEVANDGKPYVVVSEPSEAQQLYMDELIQRSDNVAAGFVDPRDDNMLKITTHARLMATDMRLIDPAFSSADSKKAQQVAENVFKVWQENQSSKATQMVFSDIGTPKTERKGKDVSIESADDIDYSFNVYQDIKDKLIEMGIPVNEIAFVHDATTDVQKEALFDKVRSGETRVLFASTQKGGTGVNVQDKLIAVHHVDVPWRPSDIEQRNGRIIRQGNTNPEVQIYNYVTKGTFDTFMWQIQEQKLKYITQIMSGKSASRSMDEMDDLVLTASEIKAVATNNPYIKEKMELENSLANLTISRNYFIKSLESNDKEIQRLQKSIPLTEKYLEKLLIDKETASRFIEKDEQLQKEYEIALNDYHLRKESDEENLVKPKEPPFEIEIEGHGLVTKKTEAGKIINTLVHNAYSEETKDYKIGHYKGFDIMGRTKTSQLTLHSEDTIYLVGDATHPLEINVSSAIGTITRLNNGVSHNIINKPTITSENLKSDKETLERLELTKDKKFDKEDEFKSLTLRLDEVNQKIEESLSNPNTIKETTLENNYNDDYDY